MIFNEIPLNNTKINFLNPGGLFTSPTLNQVTDPTITNAECELTYGAVVTEDLICISAEGGKGVCSVSNL